MGGYRTVVDFFDWLEIDVEAVMFICFQCIYFRVNVLLDA